MRELAEIGLGRAARRGYDLSDIALVAQPSDATMSPASAIEVGRLGGLGVLNAEGLWTRYEDPQPQLRRIAEASADPRVIALLQEIYAAPVIPELITARIKEISAAGVTTAVRVSPQHTLALAPTVLAAGVDVLVIQGTIVSAEHVSTSGEPLNLKEFIADLDVPVIVGGCANYQTALHLMRTGAAGIIIGIGEDRWSTADDVLGIRVPLATAIVDASAARRDYLDETGGRYVHVIASGNIVSGGTIAKALACGADAVMLGFPLRRAEQAPGGGAWWDSVAAHPRLPRGLVAEALPPGGSLEQVLFGPADDANGGMNLFGALKRVMAKTGYMDLKEFQKVELVLG